MSRLLTARNGSDILCIDYKLSPASLSGRPRSRPCPGSAIRQGQASDTAYPTGAVDLYRQNRHRARRRALASSASHAQRPAKAPRRPSKPAKSPRQGVADGERFGVRSGPLFESAQRHSRLVLKGIFPCMPLVPTPALPTSYATGWASASLTRMMVWRLVPNSRATEATEWPSESFWRTIATFPLSRL